MITKNEMLGVCLSYFLPEFSKQIMKTKSSKMQFFYILLYICTTLFVLVFVLPLLGIMYLVRVLVSMTIRYCYKDIKLMSPLDATSSVNVDGRSFSFSFGCLVSTQNAIPMLEKLRVRIGTHVNSDGPYKKLRYRLCTRLGYPCWEDTGVDGEIDIGNHVKLCPGVEDERKTFSEKEMMKLFRDNINSQRNIVAQQPDWGIFLIPKVQIKSEKFSSQTPPHAAIFIQFNHGYMDGNSAVHFIKTCVFDEEEDITTVEVMRKPQDTKSLRHRLIRYFRVVFDSPFSFAKVVIRNKHSIFHVTSPSSEATFVGCSISKIQSSSMNKVRAAFNCGTRSVVSFAFLKAVMRVADRKGFSPPKFVNYACTHSIVPYSHLKPQNGFAFLIRTIPTSGSDQLVEIDKLLQVNEDNEYELDAGLMAFYFMGLMPSRILSLFKEQLAVFPCGATLVPASGRMYKIESSCVNYIFCCPPAIPGTNYTCAFNYYEGKFNVTFHLRRTPLVETQFEFQDFIAEFEQCFNDLVMEADKLHNHTGK
ncbi:unnamed protein product [Orchesella dallaii]|uniref:O-acyltransferase WSD1 C-terminal domain-containing protein n=1 Tax=Orchesella dallaii TaxID=48710 RepID=A0ABP1Q2Q5_9HEXA